MEDKVIGKFGNLTLVNVDSFDFPLNVIICEKDKYNECKDKLTGYDIALIIHDIDNYSTELTTNREKITELNDNITELSHCFSQDFLNPSSNELHIKVNKKNKAIVDVNNQASYIFDKDNMPDLILLTKNTNL